MDLDEREPADATPRMRLVARAGWYAWRIVGLALVVVGLVWLLGQLLIVVVPVAVATLLARALTPVHRPLTRRWGRRGVAAAVTLAAFVIALALVIGAVGWAVAGEVDQLGPTVQEAVDDVERWLIEDSPFEVDARDVERWRERAGDALSAYVSSGSGAGVVSGATLAAEVVLGLLLAFIVTFFFLRDGVRMVDRVVGSAPAVRRDRLRRSLDAGWQALGGYLRGAVLLGIVEAATIGVTVFAVGGRLVLPVMVVTFLAAFVPIVGAVTAGLVATLVTLATAGLVPALIVAAVAVVVQQLDNDLLAPIIYGRALQLHPLVILLGIAAGGALFGLVGTLFAVPVIATSWNMTAAWRRPETASGAVDRVTAEGMAGADSG